jgi:hypothetical protein
MESHFNVDNLMRDRFMDYEAELALYHAISTRYVSPNIPS